MIASLLANWKTGVAGLLLILAGGLEACGVSVPGLAGGPDSLIVAGIGLVFAKDAAK